MNSSRPNKSIRRLLLVSVLALLFFGSDALAGGALSRSLRSVLAPVSSWGTSVGSIVTNSRWWTSRSALLSENLALKKEIALLRTHDSAFQAMELENQSLSKLVSVAENKRGVTAAVISSFSASPYGTFVIGVGEEDHVPVGAIVLSESGFAIGQVSDISAGSATVKEVFAPGASIAAKVGAIAFSIEGKGGGNAFAKVPKESLIHEGDVVLAPSLAGKPVGIVGHTESASSSAYSNLYIRFPDNFNTVSFVFVLL